MKKLTQSVSKAEWGEARKEFNSRLPEILEKMKTENSNLGVYKSLDLKISYSQFSRHLKTYLNSLSPSLSSPPVAPAQPERSSKIVQAGAGGGGFSIPTIELGEDE